MGVDLPKTLSTCLEAFFSNNIDVKVIINPLFKAHGSNSIFFLIFSGLRSGGELSLRPLYYISGFFYFDYGLYKISSLGPIFKALKFFSLTFVVVVFVYHCSNTKT